MLNDAAAWVSFIDVLNVKAFPSSPPISVSLMDADQIVRSAVYRLLSFIFPNAPETILPVALYNTRALLSTSLIS